MASYVEQTLLKGEVVLLSVRIALNKYWLNFVLAGLLTFEGIAMLIGSLFATKPEESQGIAFGSVMSLILAALFVLPPIIRYLRTELTLTNRRVVAKFGLFSLNTMEIKLEKIESISVNQGLFGKMLNYGTIVVTGTGASHAIIPNIADPIAFRKRFDRAIDAVSETPTNNRRSVIPDARMGFVG